MHQYSYGRSTDLQCSDLQCSSKVNRGFTLVEILVVIAVIALLSALLFPALSRAREGGRTKACLSNMKQLGLAFQQYVQDAGRRYPGAAQKQKWFSGGHWIKGDQNYAPNGQALALDGAPYTYQAPKRADVEGGAIYSYSRSAQLYVCPSDPDGRGKNLSYSMNCAIAGLHDARLLQPSEIILLVDEHTTNDGFFYTEGSTSTDHLTAQHNGGGNLLFTDGHAKFFSLDKYPLKDSALDSASITLKKNMTMIPRFYDRAFGPNGYNDRAPAFGTCQAP